MYFCIKSPSELFAQAYKVKIIFEYKILAGTQSIASVGLQAKSYSGKGYVSNNTADITFTKSNPDENGIVKLEAQIKNSNASFSPSATYPMIFVFSGGDLSFQPISLYYYIL